MQTGNREPGLDLVRVFASLSVVAVHFYLNCYYYETPLAGTKMMAMTFGRWFFMICVPLFMMLTGYLQCNRTFGAAHYLSLIPVLVVYVIVATVKVIVSNIYYGAGYYSFVSALEEIATYRIAWYVGMYVALMLLVPFLNKLWEALDERMRKALIATLAVIGCLYPLVGYVVPSYWQILYPFVYYYLGAYIRTYRPKVRKGLAVLTVLLVTLIEAAVSFYAAHGGAFNWSVLCEVDSGYSSLTVVIAATAFFLLFYDVPVGSVFLRTVLAKISSVSLAVYLFTGVYDVVIYSYLKQTLTQAPDFFWLFFLTVPLNLICSVLSGLLLQFLLTPLTRAVSKLRTNNGSK